MPNHQGIIVLMGSGELTATMVEVHKALVRRYGPSANAVFMDTPAGFQLNADQIAQKACDYFAGRIQHTLQVASFKSAADPAAEKAFSTLRRADYILIGPGSPTYAIDQLRQSPVPAILHKRIEAGGCLVSASAAALTMGRLTLPVYEIYKVGRSAHWVDGLDILGHFGLDLVVVPHWNNAEGGNHDTRYCFMGAQRLAQLEALIPDETPILGLDEHTALIIDLAARRLTIRGIGSVTLRRSGRDAVFTPQDEFPFEMLSGELETGHAPVAATPPPASKTNTRPAAATDSTWEALHALAEKIRAELEARLPDQATAGLLEMERLLWNAHDELEGEMGSGAARDIFRESLAALGTHAANRPANREACLQPVVEALLALRTMLRSQKQWAVADALRDCLQQAGIIIEDTPQGAHWHIRKGHVDPIGRTKPAGTEPHNR